MQDLPWFGKRDLKKNIAAQEALASQGKSQGTWAELAAKVKTAHAQRYFLQHTQALTRELLDLTQRLASVAQVRYASGLAMQQEAIRAQVEQTAMQTELLALEGESRQADARLNALLARPSNAPLAPPERLRPVPSGAKLDADALMARVRQSNPQLFAEESRIRSAELGRDLSLKNRYPDFTLSVTPTQVQSRIAEWEPDAGAQHPAATGFAPRPGARGAGHAVGGAIAPRSRCQPGVGRPVRKPGRHGCRSAHRTAGPDQPAAAGRADTAGGTGQLTKTASSTLPPCSMPSARCARPGKAGSRRSLRPRCDWLKLKN